MELNYLKAFYEVAKSGTFSAAAKRLNTSQSALSRSVALLEDAEGIKLFERNRRGVSLTPTGLQVMQHCEQLFQTVNRITGICRGIRETYEGPLRFATVDHVIGYILAKPLQTFRDEFPGVVPTVMIGAPDEIVSLVINGDAEFGLLFAKVPLPQLEYTPLYEEPMSLVVQAEVWKRCRSGSKARTLNNAVDEVGYISSVGAYASRRTSRVLIELFGKMPRIGFEANSQEAQKRVCLSGGGIAYLARFMVAKEIARGDLVEINVEQPHKFYLWLVRRKDRELSPTASVFLDRLKTKFK